jgi:hypothetical protein
MPIEIIRAMDTPTKSHLVGGVDDNIINFLLVLFVSCTSILAINTSSENRILGCSFMFPFISPLLQGLELSNLVEMCHYTYILLTPIIVDLR